MATTETKAAKTAAEVGTEIPKWLQDPLFRGGHGIVNNRWKDTDTTPKVFYSRVEQIKALQVDDEFKAKLMKPFKDALLAEIRDDAEGLPVFAASDVERVEKSGLLPEISADQFAEIKKGLTYLKEHTKNQAGAFRAYIKFDPAQKTLRLEQDNVVVRAVVDGIFKWNANESRSWIGGGNTGLVANYDLKIGGDYPFAEEVEKAMEKFKQDKEKAATEARIAELQAQLEGKGIDPAKSGELARKQQAENERLQAEKAAAKANAKDTTKAQIDVESERYIKAKMPVIKTKLELLVANKVISAADMAAIIDEKPENTEKAVKNLQKALKIEATGKFTSTDLIRLLDMTNVYVK